MSFPLPAPMRRALDLAADAAAAGEVPVGAVVTQGDEIIAEARNAMRGSTDPTAHAEMVAIRARGASGSARRGSTIARLWVTLEPCAMCAAAIALARIAELRFAPRTPRAAGWCTARASSLSRPAITGPKCSAGSAKRRRRRCSAPSSPPAGA